VQLNIQKFIQEHPSIYQANCQLAKNLAIKIKPQVLPVGNNGYAEMVYVYNYDHSRTPLYDPIGNECRGLILNDKAQVVSFSFPRFYHPKNPNLPPFEWKGARLETKLDGTLVVIYSYGGTFFIQTRANALADDFIRPHAVTFVEEIMKVLHRRDSTDPFKDFCPQCCYAFEFTSPLNRIVTRYDEADLTLLAIFDKTDLSELPREFVEDYNQKLGFNRPEMFFVDGYDQALELVNAIDKLDEGFVAIDVNNHRLKLKSPVYRNIFRLYHHKTQPVYYIKLVLAELDDEVAAEFPGVNRFIIFVKQTIDRVVAELEVAWEKYQNCEQADFARAVKDYQFKPVLFIKKQQPELTMRQALYSYRPDKLPDYLLGYMKKYCRDEYETAYQDVPKNKLKEI